MTTFSWAQASCVLLNLVSISLHNSFFLADAFRVDKWACHLRYGDADDHVVELQALLLQLVLDVDVTAGAALWRPAVYCAGGGGHGHTLQYSSKTVLSVIYRSAMLCFQQSVDRSVRRKLRPRQKLLMFHRPMGNTFTGHVTNESSTMVSHRWTLTG